MGELKDRYDKRYTENRGVFGPPEKIVEDIMNYKNGGTVLELGAGQGRNSLFLASQGFEVSAVDVSSVGIAQLEEKAKEKDMKIKTYVEDIQSFDFGNNFDVIVSTLVFHFLSRESAIQMMRLVQSHTNIGGLNAISSLTKDGDFYRNNPATDKFYLAEGELRELYDGWEILEYREENGQASQKNPDGSPMFNVAAKILARKI